MNTLVQLPSRNDFSFIGLSERWITEEADYLKIFKFEKLDYLPKYIWFDSYKVPIFLVVFIYLGIVWRLHKWMKTREAFNLRRPLFVWSSLLAGLSMIMFSRMLPELIYINKVYGFYRSYCKMDHINAATAFWGMVYIVSKILEFFDTVFIILRKQKLTFLHVFHHASIYIACLLGVIKGDPSARYFVVMNTFVHSVMYSYFALKAAGFKLSRKLSMAVTTVQLTQFAIATAINILAIYAQVMNTQPTCDRPWDISMFYFALGLFYFYLFARFFFLAYVNKPKIQ